MGNAARVESLEESTFEFSAPQFTTPHLDGPQNTGTPSNSSPSVAQTANDTTDQPVHVRQPTSGTLTGGASAGDDEFLIRLEFFQGPMDLLLHLVARQEVSIEEVKMSLLAEQYLQIVIRAAERIDLERAGDYLVIASTLLAIKSGALLPAEVENEAEELGDWLEGNPFFEDLRSRLQAYHETQQRAELLRKLPQLDVDTFARRDRKLLNPTPEMLQEPEDVFSLGGLFASLLKRIGAGSSFKITAHPFAVVDFMVSIVDSLTTRKAESTIAKSSFRDLHFSGLLRLLRGSSRKGSNRTVVIGGFIAVLELMKRGLVRAEVTDSEHFALSLSMDTDEQGELAPFSSEFDDAPEPQSSDAESTATVDQSDDARILQMDVYRPGSRAESNGDDELGRTTFAPGGGSEESRYASNDESELNHVERKVVGLQSGTRE